MAYATTADVSVKWRALTTEEVAAVDAHLAEGSALLLHLIPGLDAAIAAGTVDEVVVRKVLTDAVLRVMRNRSGATSQTIGPEAATFSGLNARGEIMFTADELALLTPVPVTTGRGTVIGSAALHRPDWAAPRRYDPPYGGWSC